MDNSLPPADELVLVDRELAQLDARRSQLLARRAWLLQVLYAPAAPRPRPPVADATPRSAQNVLLTLGGTLLTVAAVAFTLVSWGSMGIGGRAAVLSVVTSAALVVPVALLRRSLVSTAESVAALGLVLMVLDAYALHRVALPETDGLGYTAVAAAVLAGAWTAYGSALSRLRIPLPVAVVAAQLPLPLGVLAVGGGSTAFAWAALVTAAADGAVVLWARPASVRITAVTGAVLLGGWALLTGGWLSLTTPWSGAALLLAGAAVTLYVSWRTPALAVAASTVTGLATVAALGGLLRTALPADWAVPGYVLCGLALASAWRVAGTVTVTGAGTGSTAAPETGVTPGRGPGQADAAAPGAGAFAASAHGVSQGTGRAGVPGRGWSGAGRGTAAGGFRLPRGVRLGLAGAGAGVAGLGVAWALPPVMAGLLGPMARTTAVWSGEHAGRALTSYPATAALVLAVAVAALAAVPRLWARCGALALAWALLTALPVSLGLPYAATLALQLLTTAAALWIVVRPDPLAHGLRAADGPGRGPGAAGDPAHDPRAAGDPAHDPRAAGGPAHDPRAAGHPAHGPRAADGPAAEASAGPAAPWASWAPQRPGTRSPLLEPGTVLGWFAYAAGLASAVSALALALDVRGATFAVLGVVLGLLTGVAVLGTDARRVVAAIGAVLTATGLVCAVAAAGGFEDHWTALALLLVPAATAAVGARTRPRAVALAVEITGAAVALPAFGLAVSRPAFLALALALGGVIAAATAVRPERRRFASWTAAVLFLLATWVRLADWEVTTPEAYTLPVTVPALVFGFLRRRRDPEASSWTAYGPGLAATLLPSLLAAWTDPEWVRPLALGVAALAVTLIGARFRLQALLVLGGAVLALDGLHELAPYVVQVVGALPRWLPPALAGLLLLAVGATYEQRLRDARRLRDRVARMR
ncbi:SCO7613 C-terminal domain-containing membrane protein [Streptomyces sp. NPDC093795]|uniref:SCO7613 C-terminal domain-containing membrane protein n=1 Tax=Streptomyces sp. NPDC093795 TaxID=3366051 RepID=UPI0037FFACCC